MKLFYTEEETEDLNIELDIAIGILRRMTKLHPDAHERRIKLLHAQMQLQIILTMGFKSERWDEARTALVESIGL